MILDIVCAAYFQWSTRPIEGHNEAAALHIGPAHHHLYNKNERGRHALLRMHFHLPIHTDFHLSQPQHTGDDGLTAYFAFVWIALRFQSR